MPLPRIGKRAGGAGDDDVVLRQLFRQFVQRDGMAIDAPRQHLRALQRAVGDGDVFRVARGEMHGIEFDHLARTDEQDALLGNAGENAFRQFDRSRSHGNQIGADLGLRAHVLGDREGALEQLVQQETQCAGLLGLAHRLFHLSQYLRFAQHHGIQPAGHTERVLYRLFLRQTVDDKARSRRQADGGMPPASRLACVGVAGAAIDLGTVAGGKDGRLFGGTVIHQVAQCRFQRLDIERNLLAHGERRGLMVDAKSE